MPGADHFRHAALVDRLAAADSEPVDILVIDDDPKSFVAVEASLGDLGGRLVSARSGEDGLRRLLKHDFALILLDVQMPTMDGFETARLIRSRGRSHHVPIIFLTAYNQDEMDILRGYELGAVDYLFKPLVPELLRAKAQVFVELQRRSAEIARQSERLREMERQAAERRLEDERKKWEAEALQRQIEEQRQINEKLEDADRRKDQFIAMLAHELRNPLAPISAGLELLRAQITPNQREEVRQVMERQLRYLTRLVDDLLDASRVSHGKVELHRTDVDMRSVVEGAVQICSDLIAERKHKLTLADPEYPVGVHVDAVRLTQVVANLLNNATRYTPEGGSIEIRWKAENGEAALSVEDSGRGIPPNFIHRVFERFAQERDGGKGLGLGLALVKDLIEMHGGSVSASSPGRGKGSCFSVRLPLADTESPAADIPAPATDQADGQPVPPSKVFLVDDDDDVRGMTCTLLRQWGFNVDSASSGAEGLDRITRNPPDVCFLDIGLPDIDGYRVARDLRKRLGARCPRLIAVTGFGQARDRERSRRAGFDAHVVKPPDPDQLRRLLGLNSRSAVTT